MYFVYKTKEKKIKEKHASYLAETVSTTDIFIISPVTLVQFFFQLLLFLN